MTLELPAAGALGGGAFGGAVSSTAAAAPRPAPAPRRRLAAWSLEEVSRHNHKGSLWLIIRGKVYDVTQYHQRHPGGAAVMLRLAGGDATEAADAAHFGSPLPANVMKDLCIGVAVPAGSEADAQARGAVAVEDDDVCSALASVQLGSELRSDGGFGGDEEEILAGEAAAVGVADLLYRHLRRDARLTAAFREESLTEAAVGLRRLLGCAFAGGSGGVSTPRSTSAAAPVWPTVAVGPHLVEALGEELGAALAEVLARPRPTPPAAGSAAEGPLAAALRALAEECGSHPRVLRLLELLRGAEVPATPATAAERRKEDEEGEEQQTATGEAAEAAAAAAATGGQIDVQSFEELVLEAEQVSEVQGSWAAFLAGAESREAAGEAVYAALFDSAPGLRGLFKTPRAVMALRFAGGLGSIVMALGSPKELKVVVETLGFQHLDLEVTVPRIAVFRDAILSLLASELGARFTPAAGQGWAAMLNYVGGAYIYVRLKFADRLRILATSWATANQRDGEGERAILPGNAEPSEAAGEGEEEREAGDRAAAANTNVPKTFTEMFRFNCTVMGFGGLAWMREVLDSFDTIVTNVSNTHRLQEECDILALRLAKCSQGPVELHKFKAVMLASLRSLVPKGWSSEYEAAWGWLWENVERMLQAQLGKPAAYERALGGFVGSLTEGMQSQLRREVYEKFFSLAPRGQDFFKQSTTRLHFIADRVVEMTLELYRNPKKMVEDISALGLRHVGYGIPTELFGPFVSGCIEVVRGLVETHGQDAKDVEDSFRWSLSLISRMLVRTINEGSTIVMQAINANSARQLRRSIACAPRGRRVAWMLSIQVGTQSISPLYNALERGALEAAGAILDDLLTIRADRERYYYGMDELFERHPDVVKRLLADAPALLPRLLDGLVWRSRVTERGRRRVNYYLKHLLQDAKGDFAKTLKWLGRAQNPKFVCHPIIVLLSDTVWNGLVYRTFLLRKFWFVLTLLAFLLGQAVFSGAAPILHEDDFASGLVVVACRAFVYCCSLTSLLGRLAARWVRALRAGETFRLFGAVPLPSFLRDESQELLNLLLVVALCAMLALEPVLRCLPPAEGNDEGPDGGLISGACPGAQGVLFWYSSASAIAMGLYFLLLLDLSALSTRVSAYVLMCCHAVPEVLLFLTGLAFAVLAGSCGASALDHTNPDFQGIPQSALSLARIAMGMYGGGGAYDELQEAPTLFSAVMGFVVVSVVFLANLLVAQLNASFLSVYKDMVGFARLSRVALICTWMPSVSRRRWQGLLDGLQLDVRLEFNEGDVGLAGGLQILELAGANPTTVETIRRYGGSTSPETPWPEDDTRASADGGEDRFDKLERLLEKAVKRSSVVSGRSRARQTSESNSARSGGSGDG